jgi:hypothetical protein
MKNTLAFNGLSHQSPPQPPTWVQEMWGGGGGEWGAPCGCHMSQNLHFNTQSWDFTKIIILSLSLDSERAGSRTLEKFSRRDRDRDCAKFERSRRFRDSNMNPKKKSRRYRCLALNTGEKLSEFFSFKWLESEFLLCFQSLLFCCRPVPPYQCQLTLA